MNDKPLSLNDRHLINRQQVKLDETRKRFNISAPGVVLFKAELSYGDDEVVVVEADGLGGAILRVVEGNYPVDYNIREEETFLNEAEAVRAAGALQDKLVAH